MTLRRLPALFALGCAVLLLPGCSSSSPSASPSSSSSTGASPQALDGLSGVPVLTDANHRAMPLDPYLLNPKQFQTISQASATLVSRCMRRLRFDYAPPAQSGDTTGIGADAPTTRMDGYFGFQTMAHAKTFGYHSEGASPQAGAQAGASAGGQAPSLTAGENTALTGTADPKRKNGPGGMTLNGRTVPDHGCVGEANRILTGSVTGSAGNPDFVVSLKFDTLAKGQRDPRTRAVFASWADCMQRKGHPYADPLAASGDARWSSGPAPTAEELRVAVADQECRHDTNVVGVWFTADFGYQQAAVKQYGARLDGVRRAMTDHLAAARKALAGS